MKIPPETFTEVFKSLLDGEEFLIEFVESTLALHITAYDRKSRRAYSRYVALHQESRNVDEYLIFELLRCLEVLRKAQP